jgi:hypothetical protein
MMNSGRFRALAILALSLFGLMGGALHAAPKVLVCTIAVDAYQYLPVEDHLKWCANDVKRFIEKLEGCGLAHRSGEDLLQFQSIDKEELTTSSSTRLEATAENIRVHLPEFLGRATDDDTVIVYASMHGANIRSADGKTTESVLLPFDFKLSRITETSIPLRWLREQLSANTKAKNVLLFLDACHSGGIGAATPRRWESISTRAIGLVFNDPTPATGRNVYTLVSCSDQEKSAEYAGFQHGVFSFWLGVGLEGAADSNGDTQVTMDELFQFVAIQVPITVGYLKSRDGKPIVQTPARFLLGDHQGNPVLFRLPVLNSARPALDRAATVLKAVLENYARGIAPRIGKQPRVFISEFSNETILGGPLGSFGSVARGLLEETLMRPKPGLAPAYAVTVQSALLPRLRNVKLETLVADAGATLPMAVPGADILVHGSFIRITDSLGDRLQLKLQITDLINGISIATVPITFQLNQDIWSLLPDSQDVSQAVTIANRPANKPASDRLPSNGPTPNGTEPKPAPETSAGATVLSASPAIDTEKRPEQPAPSHPLRSKKGAILGCEIYQGPTGGKKQRVEWLPENPKDRNLLAFETEANQELEIRIKNPRQQWLAVIVQIDGLNQIGQKPQLPSEARYWLLPPETEAKIDQWLDDIPPAAAVPGSKTFEISGNKLLVVSPPESVAGRLDLFDNLGEIRIIAFPTEMIPDNSKSGTGDLGIGAGSRASNEYMWHRNYRIDRSKSLGTYVIRYQKKA